jgi:electron transfer flavoprotein alpha subunit
MGMECDLLSLRQGDLPEVSAQRVLSGDLQELPPADGLAPGIAKLAETYTHVAAVSSMTSKDVMARVAGEMGAAMVTDAVRADSPTTFLRPVVAGSALALVEVLQMPVVITFRPAGFAAMPASGAPTFESVRLVCQSLATRVSASHRGGSRPDLTQAKVVVSGGRPLRDAETFEAVIGGLADALGGAVGATRAAVDSGIAPNEAQVGQTGKIVAPDLYIAAGISGSTQHMAGIKDSKIIVAINKDPDAPIFQFADYGIVGDLFEVIPALRAALGK